MSLPIATHVSSNLLLSLMEGIQKHSDVWKLCRNQTPKPPRISRTSTFKSQEHSKRNHSSHFSRSQSSLESSSKASINTKRLQISESLQIQASKIQNNFHYKFSKTRNIRRTFKASRNFKDLYPLIFIIFKF